MYLAKDSGRNIFQFYQQEMYARALDRRKLDGAFRMGVTEINTMRIAATGA